MRRVYLYEPNSTMVSFRAEQWFVKTLREAGDLLQVTQAGIVRTAVEEWLNRMIRDGGLQKMSAEERVYLAWTIRSPIRRQRKRGLSGASK